MSWTNSGFCDVQNLCQAANKHSRSEDHMKAGTALQLLGSVNIDRQMDESVEINRTKNNIEVEKNRKMLSHHIRAVVYLVTQGLALRGHDESKTSNNRGNFIELLDVFSKFSLDVKLIDALEERSEEDKRPVFSGLSSDIQNDLIECVFNCVMTKIVARIQNSKFVSIMADESTDIGPVS